MFESDAMERPADRPRFEGQVLSWTSLCVFGLWFAVAAIVVALYGGTALDDFFITYRYAQNFAAGVGFVFNEGQRVFGLTEPAHGFVLALGSATTRIPPPWLGAASTALSLLALGWLLTRGARSAGRVPEALVAGTLLITMPVFWGNRGAGVLPGLALLAAAAALRHRPWLAGVLAALAPGFRPELALGVLLLFTLLLVEERRRVLRFLLAAALVGTAGLLACALWFDTALPITLGAKQSFADWNPAARASGRHFWPAMLPVLEKFWAATWLLFLIAALLGCLLLLRRGTVTEKVLVALGLALVVIYPLLGVPFFEWYAIPTVVAAVLGFTHFAFAAGRSWVAWRMPRSSKLAIAGAVAIPAAILLLALPPIRTLAEALRRPAISRTYLSYRETGEWIRAHSTETARVASLEVGTLAYFADREVVDLLGLVTPQALDNVRDRTVLETLRRDPTDFFVLTTGLEGLIGPVRTLPWFVEQAFADALGPIGGQRVADTGRRLLAFPEYAVERVGETVGSYARDEAGLLARGDEARVLAQESAALAARVDAFAARLDALAARLPASPAD